MANKMIRDGNLLGYYDDDDGHFVVCEEGGSDEQLGNHFDDVQNGNGYYDESGKYRSYSSLNDSEDFYVFWKFINGALRYLRPYF